jgi:hypothetical protein
MYLQFIQVYLYGTLSFELFIYSCDAYFSNTVDQWLDNKKATATDKDGNTVQYTYHIACKEIQTYTAFNI